MTLITEVTLLDVQPIRGGSKLTLKSTSSMAFYLNVGNLFADSLRMGDTLVLQLSKKEDANGNQEPTSEITT